MTMLRQDAEENSCPGHVLTLTSKEWFTGTGDKLTAKAYGRACATFWQAFRRRWGRSVEYCGFIEWTTGEARRSGGKRRMHSHWLVKGLVVDDVAEVEAWVSAEWRKLTGAWVVQLAELRTVGGIVGYLALHHEKASQAPPEGWTGRRLRPSKGYFATDGKTRRERAREWLRWYRLRELDEGAQLNAAARPAPRVVFSRSEGERTEAALSAGPSAPGYFDSLPARVALDAQLRRAAQARADESAEDYWTRAYSEMVTTLALRSRARRRLSRTADARPDG
jgi:hypothetical protein